MANLKTVSKKSKAQSMGMHTEVLTGRTQQKFFNPDEAENFYYFGTYDVDFNKRTELDVKDMTAPEANKEIDNLMSQGYGTIVIKNPQGKHSLGVGILNKLNLIFEGSLGYFGMGSCDGPIVRINGRVGWSCAENLMAGKVVIEKNAGSCFGAAIRGGDLICIQIKSPPLIAAPKQDPAFFSITTLPAIKFSAHDQPTLPLILTIGPSHEPIPKYPKLPSKIKLSLFKIPTPRLCLPCGFFITIVPYPWLIKLSISLLASGAVISLTSSSVLLLKSTSYVPK